MPLVRYYSALFQDQLQAPYVGDVLERIGGDHNLEAEMTEALGAEKGERAAHRQGYRSGYYGRTLITRIGKLELRVPQDRAGRFSTESNPPITSVQQRW